MVLMKQPWTLSFTRWKQDCRKHRWETYPQEIFGWINKLPEKVETYIAEHGLSDEERNCSKCSDEMEVIGKKLNKHLKIIPA